MLINKGSELGPSHLINSKYFENFVVDNMYELTKFHDHIIYGSIDTFKTVCSFSQICFKKDKFYLKSKHFDT